MGPANLVHTLERTSIIYFFLVFPRCVGPSKSWNEIALLGVMLDPGSCDLRVCWGRGGGGGRGVYFNVEKNPTLQLSRQNLELLNGYLY